MNVKERILAACRELAKEKGFYRMTVDELAAWAGVSKRTLYRYFHSKQEIMEASIDEFMAEMVAAQHHLIEIEQDPEIFMKSVFEQLYKTGQFIVNPLTLDDLRLHYPDLWYKVDSFRMERVQIILQHWLDQSDTDTQIKPGIDPRIMTAATMACISAVLNPDFIIKNGFTFESAARHLIRFLSGALK